MEIINKTNFIADWMISYNEVGKEQITIIIKGTYLLPLNGLPIKVAENQTPLIEGDMSTGEAGLSATLYETDYASFKPRCDVLYNGCAYSPYQSPVREVDVSLQVANMKKSFRVMGNRYWQDYGLALSISEPQPFDKMLISYDNAFGGVDINDNENPRYYVKNPVGRGYSYHRLKLDGVLLPNTEEIGHPISKPNGNYTPMAFGPIGRSWQPRVKFAGTYDKNWIENIMPFWPPDFDEQYFQAAPPDQQIPYLTGGEQVVLQNLSSQATLSFSLPKQHIPVIFTQHQRRRDILMHSVVDTLVIEPELGIFTMTSRAVLPLRKNCFDLKEIIVGEVEREWYHRQRSPNKTYYANLADFVYSKEKSK